MFIHDKPDRTRCEIIDSPQNALAICLIERGPFTSSFLVTRLGM
jgi:hypothetical protein